MPIPASTPTQTRSATPPATSQAIQPPYLDQTEHFANLPTSEQANFPHTHLASLTAHTQRSIPPSPTGTSEAPYTTHANHVITPVEPPPAYTPPLPPYTTPTTNSFTIRTTDEALPQYMPINGSIQPIATLESSARSQSTTQPSITFNICPQSPDRRSQCCLLIFLLLLIPTTILLIYYTDFHASSIYDQSTEFSFTLSAEALFATGALSSFFCTLFYSCCNDYNGEHRSHRDTLPSVTPPSNNRIPPMIQRLLALINPSNSTSTTTTQAATPNERTQLLNGSHA